MDKSLRFKTRKWRKQFVFFRQSHWWVSGTTVVVMSETASNICSFSALGFSSFHLAYCKTESHCRSSSSASSYSLRKFIHLWPVTLAILFWTYNLCFLQLADCCFLALWFVNFFLSFFKARTNYGYFHYVGYGIFPFWFSLNQMLKFSVLFATEVEKKTDHCMDVLIEVFARQKT